MKVIILKERTSIDGKMREKGEVVRVPDNYNDSLGRIMVSEKEMEARRQAAVLGQESFGQSGGETEAGPEEKPEEGAGLIESAGSRLAEVEEKVFDLEKRQTDGEDILSDSEKNELEELREERQKLQDALAAG